MNSNFANAVAHLDGYLSGAVAVDGGIRQYTAGAFVVPDVSGTDSPSDVIRNFYSAQTDFQFSSSVKLEHGLCDLEQHLGNYLIRTPWGVIEQVLPQKLIDSRRAFLAFRVMDMISEIAPEARKIHNVHKLESASESSSQVTFFCVGIDAGLLVLQFNDDSLFIRANSTE